MVLFPNRNKCFEKFSGGAHPMSIAAGNCDGMIPGNPSSKIILKTSKAPAWCPQLRYGLPPLRDLFCWLVLVGVPVNFGWCSKRPWMKNRSLKGYVVKHDSRAGRAKVWSTFLANAPGSRNRVSERCCNGWEGTLHAAIFLLSYINRSVILSV